MSGPERLEHVVCSRESSVRDALARMATAAHKGLPAGIALVCASDGTLEGVVTDGDVRRGLLKGVSLESPVADVMQADPITFPDSMTYSAILEQIPRVVEERERYRSGVIDKIVLVDADRRPTRLLNFYQLWEHQITAHRHIVVVGLGFVGLTLALVLAEEGFRVTGIESDPDVRASLRAGEPHFHEVGIGPLLRECLDRTFEVEDSIPDNGDVFIITVGTPVDGEGEPDLGYVRRVSAELAGAIRPGGLVILRSTVPVGTTRDVVATSLEEASGLKAGVDFHVAYAPERTIEGDALRELRQLPQIVGGLTSNCLDVASAFFSTVTPTVVRVDSLEEAEMVKIINNGFRDVSFAFSNQIAQVCKSFNIDAHRLIRAANQGYPRNPLPKPSPGVGGICLEKDPYILGYVVREASADVDEPMSRLGRRINESMPFRVVSWVEEALEALGKPLETSAVLLAGMAFKGRPETSDMRGSPSLKILHELEGRCREIRLHDPVVPLKDLESLGHRVTSLPEGFEGADAALVLTNHLDYGRLDLIPLVESMSSPAVLFDGWDILDRDIVSGVDGLVYLGLGYSSA